METQAGDVAAYIPTNIISITDGQLFLESDLFYKGVRPAINIGISVRRVGSAAQTKAMKAVSGNIKIEMAQYNELSSFSQFSSDLDSTTKELLDNGQKVLEILKQPQYCSFKNSEHVIVLYAVMKGYLKDISVKQVKQFENDLLKSANTEAKLLEKIDTAKSLTDELKKEMDNFLKKFKTQWIALNEVRN